MSNTIDINDARNKKPHDQETLKMWNLANTIDNIVIEAIKDGMSPNEVAGVISNRLGEMCGAIKRTTGISVVEACIDLIKKQSSTL